MKRRPVLAGLVAAGLAIALSTSGSAHAASSGLDDPIHQWNGDQVGERFGWAVSELADIDGDGAQEAIIGAPFHTEAGVNVGHADVRSGRTGELIYRFEGAPEDRHGYAIADAGDVDGDGTADIIVGAPGSQALACVDIPRAGRAYVYSGADGALIHQIDGEAAGDQFGAAVASAGDVNRDGHADLLVGAPCADGPAGVDAGRAYLVSGRTGALLRAHDGREAGDWLGSGAAPVGDLDRDHRVDYVIGAKDAGRDDRGQAYVFSGRTGKRLLKLQGDRHSADFGWFFVASAGDVNRDGRNDIYVGDFCALDEVGGCSLPRGQAYVFSGKNGKLLHLFTGAEPGDGMGPGRSAGDVNGDGRDDLVVGSYLSSAGAPFAGRVTVFSGKNGKVLRDFVSTNAGETLGFDAVGIGDVNGDRVVDLLLSGAVADVVYVVSSG